MFIFFNLYFLLKLSPFDHVWFYMVIGFSNINVIGDIEP